MRKRSKIPYFILVLILALAAAYILCIFRAKTYISNVIEKSIKRSVLVDSAVIGFPLSLQINGIRIFEKAQGKETQEFFSAGRIVATPSVVPLFAKRLILKELKAISPSAIITRYQDGSFNFSDIFSAKKEGIEKQDMPRLYKRSGFVILSTIRLIDGHITYIDKQITENGICLIADNLYLHITKLSLPFISMNTNINVSADISAPGEPSAGRFKLSGWVNLAIRDMDLDLHLDGIDIRNIKPYLKNIATSAMKSGTAYFTSNIISRDNKLTAECNLKIKDIEFETFSDIKFFGIPLSAVTDLVKDEQKELFTDFTIETGLDDFKPKITRISGNLVSTALKATMSKGIEKTLETVDNGEERIEEKIEKIGEKLKDLLQIE